jgi:hypothetical protein
MNVSFDFDSTVARFVLDPSGIKRCIGPDPDAVSLMKLHRQAGDTIHIITSRKEKREKHLPTIDPITGEVVRPRVLQFLRDHGLMGMVSSINFTNDQLKGHSAVMFNLDIQVHYDDREEELMSLPPEVVGIPAWEMKTVRSVDRLFSSSNQVRESISRTRTKQQNNRIITEARLKSFRRVMRAVYHNLPEFVFNDMYGHEKQWSNIQDGDIGGEVKRLADDVMSNEPNAIENFRQFEKERGSEWLDTVWNKKPRVIQLHWNDLSEIKRDFFEKKYMGKNEWFLPRTTDGSGYMDKLIRVLPSVMNQIPGKNEPVLLLQRRDAPGYDVIGGNNRIFNAFLAAAIQEVIGDVQRSDGKGIDDKKIESSFRSIFEFLNDRDPAIEINAYVGKET